MIMLSDKVLHESMQFFDHCEGNSYLHVLEYLKTSAVMQLGNFSCIFYVNASSSITVCHCSYLYQWTMSMKFIRKCIESCTLLVSSLDELRESDLYFHANSDVINFNRVAIFNFLDGRVNN